MYTQTENTNIRETGQQHNWWYSSKKPVTNVAIQANFKSSQYWRSFAFFKYSGKQLGYKKTLFELEEQISFADWKINWPFLSTEIKVYGGKCQQNHIYLFLEGKIFSR